MNKMWALVFLVCGAVLLAYGTALVRDARTCARWPVVPGEIVYAQVETVTRQKDRRSYSAKVRYTYRVNDRMLEGTRIQLVPTSATTESSINELLSRYPINAAVSVHYDRGDPSNAVLDTTATGTEWAFPIAGVIFLVCGFVFFRSR